jgi:hypothetical protein
VNGSTVIKNGLPACSEVTGQSAIAGTTPPGYYAQALIITAVRHALIIFADLLRAISMIGFIVVLCLVFQGAHANAAADTERRRP